MLKRKEGEKEEEKVNVRQGKARLCKETQGQATQGRARLDRTGQGNAKEGKSRRDGRV